MVRQALFPVFEEHLGLPQRAWDEHPLVKNWNRSEYLLELVNDSRIYFVSLDKPERLEGITVNWGHLTEARLLRDFEGAWRTLTRRIRRDGFQAAWLDTHSPTKELVELFAQEGYRIYRWSTRDAYEAGVISERYYQDMVSAHHGARAQAVLEGEYARPEGLVYDQFDPARHIVPKPDPPIPERPDEYEPWTQWMSYGADIGYSHATCLSAWAWNGSIAHGVDEWWARYRSTPDIIQEALEMEEQYGSGVWWFGPERGQTVQEFQDAGLDARQLPTELRDVDEGCKHVNDRYAGDELRLDPGMLNTLEEIDMYAMDEEKDEPEKDAPDSMDSQRYGVVGGSRGSRLSMGTVDR